MIKRYYSYIEEVAKLPSVLRIMAAVFAVLLLAMAGVLYFTNFFTADFSVMKLLMVMLGVTFISLGVGLFVVGKAAKSSDIRKQVDMKYASKPAYRRFLQEIQKLKILANISEDAFKQYMAFLQKENEIIQSGAFARLPEEMQNRMLAKLEDLDYFYLKLIADKDFIKKGEHSWEEKKLELQNKLAELDIKISQAPTERLKNSLQKRKDLLEDRLKNTKNIKNEIQRIEVNLEHIEETLEYMAEKLVLHGSSDAEALLLNLENTIDEIDMNLEDFSEIGNMMPGYEEQMLKE